MQRPEIDRRLNWLRMLVHHKVVQFTDIDEVHKACVQLPAAFHPSSLAPLPEPLIGFLTVLQRAMAYVRTVDDPKYH